MKPLIKPVVLLSAVSALIMGVFAVSPKATEAKPKPGDVPVIVELFTSEGCSSCPPADTALIDLAKTQPVPGATIIALGYHVDYWNRLGWRDPFSSATYSARQEAYRARYNNDSVYTPQAVVNGGAEFVGSDVAKARTEIARAADHLRKSPITVSVMSAGNDSYTVNISEQLSARSRHLFVAVTENGLSTEVKRGENAGRRLSHVAVVRRLIPLGEKTTATISLPVAAGEQRSNQHIVAWVQEGNSGAILGASQVAR